MSGVLVIQKRLWVLVFQSNLPLSRCNYVISQKRNVLYTYFFTCWLCWKMWTLNSQLEQIILRLLIVYMFVYYDKTNKTKIIKKCCCTWKTSHQRISTNNFSFRIKEAIRSYSKKISISFDTRIKERSKSSQKQTRSPTFKN